LAQDLFSIKADTKIIATNMRGAMGAGIAKTARDTIPGLYAHYKKLLPTTQPTQFILYRHEGVQYVLLPTKLDWRDPSPRDLVIHNLHRLINLTQRHPDKFGTVALPPLGCGNGGLDFKNDIRYVYLSLLPFIPTPFIACVGTDIQPVSIPYEVRHG